MLHTSTCSNTVSVQWPQFICGFMTTEERIEVRGALIKVGFQRITTVMPENPIFYDYSGRGNYREVWQSNRDNTLITVDWDYKSK